MAYKRVFIANSEVEGLAFVAGLTAIDEDTRVTSLRMEQGKILIEALDNGEYEEPPPAERLTPANVNQLTRFWTIKKVEGVARSSAAAQARPAQAVKSAPAPIRHQKIA
jgi:hypothetical protein